MPTAIRSYVSAYRSVGGHMDLRFCMPERRGRGGRGQCGCGASLVHIEVSAAGEADPEEFCWARVLRTIDIKRKENAVFERQQVEAPVETLVRGS